MVTAMSWPEVPQGQVTLHQHSIAGQPWTLTAEVGPLLTLGYECMRRLGLPQPPAPLYHMPETYF